MAENVLVAIQDRILTIRINRPDKKNALTRAMYIGMTEAIRRADEDSSVRVILLTGSDDCFTAGNDIASEQNHAHTRIFIRAADGLGHANVHRPSERIF